MFWNFRTKPLRNFLFDLNLFASTNKKLLSFALTIFKSVPFSKKSTKFGVGDSFRKFTPFRIKVNGNNDFTLSEPLDQFHFALLCGYISEFYVGNPISTPSIVYRAITGKVGTDAMPHKDKNQLTNILSGTDKLMRTQLGINITDYCQKLNRDKNKTVKIISAILLCKRVSEKVLHSLAYSQKYCTP